MISDDIKMAGDEPHIFPSLFAGDTDYLLKAL